MSRTERWNARDQSYPNGHRTAIPEAYPRTGHRTHVADRDWTEFCCWCKWPLAIVEEVRDVGQDLKDKGTTVTERLAALAGLPAYLAAWKVDRPDEVQAEIDQLNQRIRELESGHPIVGFKVQDLAPSKGPLLQATPAEWWATVRAIHGTHWQVCAKAPASARPDGLPGVVRTPLHVQGMLLP